MPWAHRRDLLTSPTKLGKLEMIKIRMTKEKKDKKQENEKKNKCPQCEEYLNGWKRAQADYENLKKQTILEKEEFVKFANLNLIISLIPVYNNFKLSFEHLPDEIKENNWVKGIEHIEKQFKQILEQNGVEEIKPKEGEKFNPEMHEAVESKGKENKIKKMLSCGYKLRVFIPAKVIVK